MFESFSLNLLLREFCFECLVDENKIGDFGSTYFVHEQFGIVYGSHGQFRRSSTNKLSASLRMALSTQNRIYFHAFIQFPL